MECKNVFDLWVMASRYHHCYFCGANSHRSSKCPDKLKSSKAINIIDENIDISITFANIDGPPVLQVTVLKNNQSKTHRTFCKDDLQVNAEKRIISFQGIYTLSFSFRSIGKVNSINIHITKDNRYLYTQTFSI